ncbi:MAG: hypothetical protein CME01_11320 [Geminicoccus sp.]|nr:hypothetical protein [Geminicoccus sp.]
MHTLFKVVSSALLATAVFVAKPTLAASPSDSQLEQLIGACLTNAQKPCAKHAEIFMRKSNVQTSTRMEQLTQALGADLCAGIVNQPQARSIMLEAMSPVRLASAISGTYGFSSSCRSAQQVAIGVMETFTPTKIRNQALSAMLRAQPTCDQTCIARAEKFYSLEQMAKDDPVAFADMVLSTTQPYEPAFAQAKMLLEQAYPRASMATRSEIRLAMIPFHVAFGQTDELIELLEILPGQLQINGDFSSGLSSAISAYQQLFAEPQHEMALALLEAFPRARKQHILRAEILANMVTCSEACALDAISKINRVVGIDSVATVAMLGLVRKFERPPEDLYQRALQASADLQQVLRKKITRATSITSLSVDETPRIIELRQDLAGVSAARAKLLLSNARGCDARCYESALAELRPFIGQESNATMALAGLIQQDYPARRAQKPLAVKGLQQLLEGFNSLEQRASLLLAIAQLNLNDPDGCSDLCRQQALGSLSSQVGRNLNITLAMASYVAIDPVRYQPWKRQAIQGLETILSLPLNAEEKSAIASARSSLSFSDLEGCDPACQQEAFARLIPFVGTDLDATRDFADLVRSNIFDFEEQIVVALRGLGQIDPRSLSTAEQGQLALSRAELLLKRPQGCDEACERDLFDGLRQWVGKDMVVTLAFANLVESDAVARRSLRAAALDGLNRLDRRQYLPSQQATIEGATVSFLLGDPQGCPAACRDQAMKPLMALLDDSDEAISTFANLIVANSEVFETYLPRARAELDRLAQRPQTTATNISLANRRFSMMVADSERCDAPCVEAATGLIKPYVGQDLSSTLELAKMVTKNHTKENPNSLWAEHRGWALASLRTLDRPEARSSSELVSIRLAISQLVLGDPKGCDAACADAAFNGIRPFLGINLSATMGFARGVLAALDAEPLTSGGRFIVRGQKQSLDLVLAPTKQESIALSALRSSAQVIRLNEAISALEDLNSFRLTFEERALRANLLANLKIRDIQGCDEACREETIELWLPYIGKNKESTLSFASLVANDLSRIRTAERGLLDELQLFNWDYSNPESIQADLRAIFEREIGDPLPQASVLRDQALAGLQRLALPRLTFEEKVRALLSKLTLLEADPSACTESCLQDAFNALTPYLGKSSITTLEIIQTVFGNQRLEQAFGTALQDDLESLIKREWNLLTPSQRAQVVSLQFLQTQGCEAACRLSALERMSNDLGTEISSTFLYVSLVGRHAPLLLGSVASQALDDLRGSSLTDDVLVELARAEDQLNLARTCSATCINERLDRWAGLAPNNPNAALEYGNLVVGRLDIEIDHVREALSLITRFAESDGDNNATATLQYRALINKLRWHFGQAPEVNPLLMLWPPQFDSTGKPLLKTPASRAPEAAVASTPSNVKSSLTGCALQAYEAAITPPAEFTETMPAFDVLPARCKIAAMQALFVALGYGIEIDGAFGPRSRQSAIEVLAKAGSDRVVVATFEDWMLIEGMRGNTSVIRPIMAALKED